MAAVCQDFTRPVPKGAVRQPRLPAKVEVVNDTIDAPSRDSLALAGFEKPLRSVRESLFVTNRSARPVTALEIEVSYYDMHGNLLHRLERTVDVALPSGETRRIEFPSFDRQQLFYYHRSPLPRGAVKATPFDVKVRVIRSIHPHNPEK